MSYNTIYSKGTYMGTYENFYLNKIKQLQEENKRLKSLLSEQERGKSVQTDSGFRLRDDMESDTPRGHLLRTITRQDPNDDEIPYGSSQVRYKADGTLEDETTFDSKQRPVPTNDLGLPANSKAQRKHDVRDYLQSRLTPYVRPGQV